MCARTARFGIDDQSMQSLDDLLCHGYDRESPSPVTACDKLILMLPSAFV